MHTPQHQSTFGEDLKKFIESRGENLQNASTRLNIKKHILRDIIAGRAYPTGFALKRLQKWAPSLCMKHSNVLHANSKVRFIFVTNIKNALKLKKIAT